jgi:hypothetical protein
MKVVLWFLMMFMPLMANASSVNEEQLFHRLDSYIAQRSKFTQRKEAKLLRLKKQLYTTSDKRSQLRLYNQIYREYYTYRYDSAMTYAKKGYQLAVQLQDDYFINLNKINRAAVLSTGGFYSQAEDLMLAMDVEKMSPKLLQYYYYTLTWVYNYWETFCNKSEFQEGLEAKKRFYLGKTLEHIGNKESALYYYLSGEFEYLKQRTSKKTLQFYMKALSASPLNSRVYASSAYCIARYYYDTDQKDLYEKYIVEAAISDQICPLKENLALQEFSTYLYNKDASYAKRVAKYLYCSMEDAQFYNNRLRMVEISRILPLITETNHQCIDTQFLGETVRGRENNLLFRQQQLIELFHEIRIQVNECLVEANIEVGCLFFCQLVAVDGSQKIGSLLCLDFAAYQFAIIIQFPDIYGTDVHK